MYGTTNGNVDKVKSILSISSRQCKLTIEILITCAAAPPADALAKFALARQRDVGAEMPAPGGVRAEEEKGGKTIEESRGQNKETHKARPPAISAP